MRNGIASCRGLGNGFFHAAFDDCAAEAEAQSGEIEGALATIDAVLGETERHGQRWFEAETYRVRGEILLRHNPANTGPAEEAFATVLAIAQAQKARTFELRAAMSMARLWRDQGRLQQARKPLPPVYGWFTGHADTSDLKDAKALLHNLLL